MALVPNVFQTRRRVHQNFSAPALQAPSGSEIVRVALRHVFLGQHYSLLGTVRDVLCNSTKVLYQNQKVLSYLSATFFT